MHVHANAGEFLTEQEIADAKQEYINQAGQDDSFLEFMIVGKRFAKSILAVDDAKGLRIDIGKRFNPETGTMQLYPILRAVTKFGNILPYPDMLQIDEETETELIGMQIMDDPAPAPVRCPASCS